MGVCFDQLSKEERAAVMGHVRTEYDKLIFQQATNYVTRHAQDDPAGWQEGMCELMAADPKRVREILEAAHWRRDRL